MIASKRKLVNKQLFITSISFKLSNIAHLLSNADIDVENDIREKVYLL